MATELTPEIARLRRIMSFDTEPFLLNRESLGALLDAAERCAAAEAQAKAAGELLRAAQAVGYITGHPGYCGDHGVVSVMFHEDTAKQWNVALQAAERAGVKP